VRATAGLRVTDDEIKQAINDAIEHYADNRFAFNEGNGDNSLGPTITTVAGTARYPLPASIIELDSVQYLHASNQYYLRNWHWQDYMRAVSDTSAVQGSPLYYTIHGGSIHLYPSPDEATTVTLSGLIHLDPTPLVILSSTNAWTNRAAALIRARAAWDISLAILGNPDLASVFAAAEAPALASLTKQAQDLLSTGQAYVPDWECV
jgi:hypothetical protein